MRRSCWASGIFAAMQSRGGESPSGVPLGSLRAFILYLLDAWQHAILVSHRSTVSCQMYNAHGSWIGHKLQNCCRMLYELQHSIVLRHAS
jgi:hypothetical protein